MKKNNFDKIKEKEFCGFLLKQGKKIILINENVNFAGVLVQDIKTKKYSIYEEGKLGFDYQIHTQNEKGAKK